MIDNERFDKEESRKKLALMQAAAELASDDDFSSVAQHNDFITAVYKEEWTSESEYEVRIEYREGVENAAETDEPYGTYLLEIDFRCPRIKPEYRAAVSEYVMSANELFSYINPYSRLLSRDFCEIVVAQSCCSEVARIPFKAHSLVRIINCVYDDLKCLASGRLPYDIQPFESIRKRYEKDLFDDLGRELVKDKEEELNINPRAVRDNRFFDGAKNGDKRRREVEGRMCDPDEESDDELFGRVPEDDDFEIDCDSFIEFLDDPEDDCEE